MRGAVRSDNPKTPIPGVPGKLRAKWGMPDGNLAEWDSQHGEFEVYDKRGRPIKVLDKDGKPTGKQVDKSRRIEP